jgi:uncharacterized protein
VSYLGVEAPRGRVVKQRVAVAEFADGSPVSLPVAVVQGAQAGPSVYVQGGVHGDEATGVEIARQVIGRIDPAELTGRVVVVTASNVPAYLTRTRWWADEERPGAEVKRLMPGWEHGLMAERLAHVLYSEFIAPSDLSIDLHSALDGCTIAPFTYVLPDEGDGTYERRKRAALAFGAPFVYRVDVEREGRNRLPLSIRSLGRGQVSWAGVAMFTAEMGESRRVSDEYVEIGVEGVRRVLADLGMLASAPEAREARDFTTVSPIHVNRGGGLHREVDVGQEVRAGQHLGAVVDLFGDVVEDLESPVDGVVLRAMLLANVATGAEAFWIAS